MPSFSHILSNTSRLRALVDGLNPRVNCQLLAFLAKARKRDDVILGRISSQLVSRYDELTPRDISSAVYGLCKFHFVDEGSRTLGILTSRVRRTISSYSLTDLSQMIVSLARVGVVNRPLVLDVTSRVTPAELATLSNQSLSNLMTGLARFGVKSTSQYPVWKYLSAAVIERLDKPTGWTPSDLLATTLAVSVSVPPRDDLITPYFSRISNWILSSPDSLDTDCVTKYIKACSRVEFRDVECLSKCASILRQDDKFPSKYETRDLLQIYSNLDKLGIDMKDLEQELCDKRNVEIPKTKSPTWFPSSNNARPKDVKIKNHTSDSLGKRKYSW